MKYLLILSLLLSTASAQVVVDCSNCSNAEWGAEYNPSSGGCASNPLMGCGPGCNCVRGFQRVAPASTGASVSQLDFFGGAFTKDGGFRIDRPGALTRNHVQPGDVAYRINNRIPARSQFGTMKRPIRKAEATWDDQGRLHLRFWR